MKLIFWSASRRKQCLVGLRLTFIALMLSTVLYLTGLTCIRDQLPAYSRHAAPDDSIPPKRTKLLINNDICSGEEVFIIAIIHSATSHLENRNVIRNTWAARTPLVPNIKVAFMLALPANDSSQRLIDKENDYSHDIIQGDFVDSYRNLTYKHIMGLQWVSENCPRARFVIKMDDDIFVDIFQLARLLSSDLGSQIRNGKTIACYFQRQMPVVRDPSSKWYVSKKEFPEDTFDDYCSGWAYVTEPSTSGVLSASAQKLPFFWVDDVHITGTVAKSASILKVRMNKYFALETQGLAEWAISRKDALWDKIFAPTWGDLTLTRNAHRKAARCERLKCKCCFSRASQVHKNLTSLPPVTGKSIVRILPMNKRQRGNIS